MVDVNERTPLVVSSEEGLGDTVYYPDDILTKWELKAWNEQKKWSKVANKKRGAEKFWRNCKLRLSIGAVVLQTLASQIQEGKLLLPVGNIMIPLPSCSRRVCSFAGGGLLIFIPYVNDRLSGERIAERADSRLVGEELLSEIWKSLSGIPPYKERDETSVKRFNKNIKNIIQAESGIVEPRYAIHPICVLPVDDTEEDLELQDAERMPKVGTRHAGTGEVTYENRKEMYMHARVGHDLKRRKEKAKEADKNAEFWHRTEIALTIGSALIGVFLNNASDTSDFGLWATVFTTAAAAVASHITACRFVDSKNGLYGVAMLLGDLKLEREQNTSNHEETELEWEKFVNDFENTLLSQTRKWRANTIGAARHEEANQQTERSAEN